MSALGNALECAIFTPCNGEGLRNAVQANEPCHWVPIANFDDEDDVWMLVMVIIKRAVRPIHSWTALAFA